MKSSQRHPRASTQVALVALGLWVFFVLTGCASGYGSLRRDPTIAQQFEANQVPTSYRYYVYGYTTRPYAIAGIDPGYEMPSKFWTAVEPNTEAFRESTRWVWEDYGYIKFGADVLDPGGEKIGVWYSALWNVTVKFTDGNRIYLITDYPFLGGPDGDVSYSP